MGGELADDAEKSREEDMKTDDSYTSTMSGWLGFGGEEKTDPVTEKEQEEQQADTFRSRRMSLDLEGSQLQEEEKEEIGTLGWLGNGLSNTLGFGTTDQESGQETAPEKEDREVTKEKEQPASGSWLNMGIGDMLGYRKDESEVDKSGEGRFKETEEDNILEQENNSQSHNELTDEVRTEPRNISKVEETPKDQNVGSNSNDIGTLDNKYGVLPEAAEPEDAESKVDGKDISPKTINSKDNQMPKSIESGVEGSNGELGEDFKTQIDTDQDFVTKPDLTLGPDLSSVELNLNTTGQSVGEVKEDTTKGVVEEGVKETIQIINPEESTNTVEAHNHEREGNKAWKDVLDYSESLINTNKETKEELHTLEGNPKEIGSSHSKNISTETLYENSSDKDRITLNKSESTTQMENSAGKETPNLQKGHAQSEGDSQELKETVKEIENSGEKKPQPVQTERETLGVEEIILNESGLKSVIGLETDIKTEEVGELTAEGNQDEVAELKEAEKQQEVVEIKEQGKQEEGKGIQKEGDKQEALEIQNEGKQQEVKEKKEERKLEEVKDIKEDWEQEVNEIQEEEEQLQVKQIKLEGKQEEIKELQEQEKKQELKGVQEKGKQEEVMKLKVKVKQEETEGKKEKEEQQQVKEVKHEGKQEELKEIQDKEKLEDFKEIKEEAKQKEEELEEKAKQREEEELKEEEELDEMQKKNINELKTDERQQDTEVEEEKHKELEGSKENNEREELEKMEGVREIKKKAGEETAQSRFEAVIKNNVHSLLDTQRNNDSPENVEGDIRKKEEEGSLKCFDEHYPQAGQDESGQETTPEKEDQELIMEEEQLLSDSWLNMGIGDILSYRKDEAEVEESGEEKFNETEDNNTLEQNNTSQSHNELRDEVRIEPSIKSRVEETPKDQYDGSDSIDMATLDSKYGVLPEDVESKVDGKYVSPKTINGHQDRSSNTESGEDFRSKSDIDQELLTQPDLTLGPDSSFVESNSNTIQDGSVRAEDGDVSADRLIQINEGAIETGKRNPDYDQMLADRTVSLKARVEGMERVDYGIQEEVRRDDNGKEEQDEAEIISLLDVGESGQSRVKREINVKHDDMQGNIFDGDTVASEDRKDRVIEVPDVENRNIISEQTLLSDSQDQKEAKTGSGAAFGLFKNAFSFFSEAPIAETKGFKESNPNFDSNTDEIPEEQAYLTPDQELESTIDSRQVQELPSPITMQQQQLQPSLSSSETSLPSPESHLQKKTLTKYYKNLLTYMSDDETTILVELFGRHKLQFLDYILGSSGTVNDDPDNDESILLDIERLLLYHREALVAPSMRLADAPQEDKEKIKALVTLQKLQMLLESLRETFKSAEASCVGESCSTRSKDKDQPTEEDFSVGLHDNSPRDDWMDIDKENGRLSGDTGNEMSTEDERKTEKGQRGIMKQIWDFVHQMAEDSTTHMHAVKELLVGLTVQVVLALPDDIRPGPDLYGLPWEPVIVSILVGLVTMLLFTCRCYSSVKSRMYRSRERRMGEQVVQLLDEKCEVLETLSKCQQEYDEVESSLRDSGVLAQTQKTESSR
ncbi:cTAGE family member 5 isoform X1 [Eleginops maclovinus]|uniref:cTAGE family member 5 isoform X1 n=1 Tax=Eleginops maclovinus TaxID=56733 RepID=UPI00307FD2BA